MCGIGWWITLFVPWLKECLFHVGKAKHAKPPETTGDSTFQMFPLGWWACGGTVPMPCNQCVHTLGRSTEVVVYCDFDGSQNCRAWMVASTHHLHPR